MGVFGKVVIVGHDLVVLAFLIASLVLLPGYSHFAWEFLPAFVYWCAWDILRLISGPIASVLNVLLVVVPFFGLLFVGVRFF